MKKFYVLCTHCQTPDLMEIESDTAENAAKAAIVTIAEVLWLYGESFRKTAQIYVFDKPPAFQILNKSK